jgi:hypothetical protein
MQLSKELNPTCLIHKKKGNETNADFIFRLATERK